MTIESLALSRLRLSSTESQAERRAHFDKAAIGELAASIKTVGLLQPIVARRVNGHYEIVAGERRYLAAKQAGLQEVQVAVRELTDEQVLEVQLVENLQREGLHELAEAEGYEALMKSHGYTVEQLVAKLARSKAYVYARLKLLSLCKDARKAFYAGQLNASTALLLARIPNEGQQKKALKEITEETWSGRMSYRRAQEHVQQNYMLKLAEAGFPTDDAALVPAAGACGACPKRTGNQPELFGDVKGADVCTDPACFAAKRAAHTERQAAAARANGQTVITGKAAEKLMSYGSSINGHVRLSDHCYEDPKNRTYRQLIGKAVTPVLVEHAEKGVLIEAVPEKEAREALKKAGIKSASARRDNTYQTQQSARAKKAKAELAFRQAVFQQILDKAPKAIDELSLVPAVREFLRQHQAEQQKEILRALGLEVKKSRHGGFDTDAGAEALAEYVSHDDHQLARAFVVLTYIGETQVSSWSDSKPERLLAEASRLKIDVNGIRKRLQAEAAAKTKKPAAKAARKAK